mmetsp:Transcript_30607/g.81423  ORF Transcript_30607/g.81423 Transcript_30607/m.81423 type:complete len:229 (+) Transcript_30607:340-1026(+)
MASTVGTGSESRSHVCSCCDLAVPSRAASSPGRSSLLATSDFCNCITSSSRCPDSAKDTPMAHKFLYATSSETACPASAFTASLVSTSPLAEADVSTGETSVPRKDFATPALASGSVLSSLCSDPSVPFVGFSPTDCGNSSSTAAKGASPVSAPALTQGEGSTPVAQATEETLSKLMTSGTGTGTSWPAACRAHNSCMQIVTPCRTHVCSVNNRLHGIRMCGSRCKRQ